MRVGMISTIITALTFIMLGQPAAAQSTGFALRPAIVEVTGELGSSTTHTVSIENTSEQALAVQLEAQSLIPIDTVIDQSRRDEFDASSWIKVENTDYLFEPGEIEEVTFTVAVPRDANPGGHYAIVALRPVAAPLFQANDSGAIVLPEIGISVFITVPGDIIEQAELETNNMISSRVTQNRPTDIAFRLRNIGNVHILPSPRITITDNDGQTVAVFPLQPQLVLPNTEKEFSVTWDATADYGKYNVRAELVYGNQSIPLSSPETQFTVAPNLWLASLLVALIACGLFLLAMRKNIPRAIAVLRGTATSVSRRFTGRHDNTELSETQITNIDASSEQIHAATDILGLPEDNPLPILDKEDSPEPTPPIQPTRKRTVPISQTVYKTKHTHTHITQTPSSTIVRESHLTAEEAAKVTSIKVHDFYDLPSIKSKSKTKKAPVSKKKTPQKSAKSKKAKPKTVRKTSNRTTRAKKKHSSPKKR